LFNLQPEHNWLDHLPDKERRAVESRTTLRKYKDGQFIYQRGDPGDELFLIRNGAVRIYSQSIEGKELLYVILIAGNCFGEQSMLDGGTRHHMARALGEVEVDVLSQSDFTSLCDQYPGVTKGMLSLLSNRLRLLYGYFEEASQLGLSARIAVRLCGLANSIGHNDADGIHTDLRITQEDISFMVAASRQSVNKVLNAWQARGIIKISYGAVLIKNFQELKKLSVEPSS
jgi:CRP/FNR family transcriptional regulator, cyclic AMP receptor protein